MRKSVFLPALLASGCLAMLAACGDDSGGSSNDGGSGGKSGNGGASGKGGSGDGRGMLGPADSEEDINPACPQEIGPFDGKYAMKGKCCYRTSNHARVTKAADKGVLEYRLSYFMTNNHPKTISGGLVKGATITRFDKEEQHILFRFELPREDGDWAKGPGKAQIGAGRYNCDGTYSFYSDKAATVSGELTDKARWAITSVDVNVDPDGATFDDQVKVVWKTNINRKVTYLPYLLAMADASGKKPLEWEAASQGFSIISMPPLEEALDCVGTRVSDNEWEPNGQTVSYQRLDANSQSAINVLGNISLAQLQAFGAAVGDKKDDPEYQVSSKRCKPGSDGCLWQKLPDSLCPKTDDEIGSWGCHVGDPDNEDKIKTECTADAPSGVLDPDEGATSLGQCCDPLAEGTNGLPACNAYRLVSDFVASAVEITDKPSDQIQPNCEL